MSLKAEIKEIKETVQKIVWGTILFVIGLHMLKEIPTILISLPLWICRFGAVMWIVFTFIPLFLGGMWLFSGILTIMVWGNYGRGEE